MRNTISKMPLYILCRDRLECTRQMVDWFRDAEGVDKIILVDFNSTYPPLLDYFHTSGLRVWPMGIDGPSGQFFNIRNTHRIDLGGGFVTHANLPTIGLEVSEFYAVSDCDCIPCEDTPKDLLVHLAQAHFELDIYKAGPALRLDDLPEHYPYRDDVRRGESTYWQRQVAPGWWDAAIDTTLAVYRGDWWHQPSRGSVRSDHPYVVRHHTWYSDLRNLPEDERYYCAHATTAANAYRNSMRALGRSAEELHAMRAADPHLAADWDVGGRFEFRW